MGLLLNNEAKLQELSDIARFYCYEWHYFSYFYTTL